MKGVRTSSVCYLCAANEIISGSRCIVATVDLICEGAGCTKTQVAPTECDNLSGTRANTYCFICRANEIILNNKCSPINSINNTNLLPCRGSRCTSQNVTPSQCSAQRGYRVNNVCYECNSNEYISNNNCTQDPNANNLNCIGSKCTSIKITIDLCLSLRGIRNNTNCFLCADTEIVAGNRCISNNQPNALPCRGSGCKKSPVTPAECQAARGIRANGICFICKNS